MCAGIGAILVRFDEMALGVVEEILERLRQLGIIDLRVQPADDSPNVGVAFPSP